MSDGETPEETIRNGQDTLACWIQACKEAGREISCPGESTIRKSFLKGPRKKLRFHR
ncbi:type II toxin-antitoxin system HicB family antitoxin [Candidatus Thiosymbion oneisti]|uniref:type II toxin-antitoxin system HicB family antitoxin n=1 Tax=Candidatus Thiosymbion oneisti TaxID=589554 RepID=UPI00210CCBF0|nr:hypothetical protein [Candidatus Thiosymbion oneisti]